MGIYFYHTIILKNLNIATIKYILMVLFTEKKKINIKRSLKKKKTIFFYSGSLDKWGGTNMLLKAIKLIKQKNFELWISGQGKSAKVENVANKDLRIKYLGLLSKEGLATYTLKQMFF